MKNAKADLAKQVDCIVNSTQTDDIHTHLFDPALGAYFLWGIDELLTYHYLVSEAFRWMDIPYDKFWGLSKETQAELIWDSLFVKHSPVSESSLGIITTLNELGIDVRKRDLNLVRKWFSQQKLENHVTKVMKIAGVESICMTNSPLDPSERNSWRNSFERDPRFLSALRVDQLLLDWKHACASLRELNYNVSESITPKTIKSLRLFLQDWTEKIDAKYLMVSMPPDFNYPDETATAKIIDDAVLPHCRDSNLPFAVMAGVKRQVNPNLRLAGDSVGYANMQAYENLLSSNQDVKFLMTLLGRENQHQLCVLARKFRNLHVFGCWWFTNIPVLINEITRMRFELLGTSFTPQHSDARIFEQIIYKWKHSREIIAGILTERYTKLQNAGWNIAENDIQRDVDELFGGAFNTFIGSQHESSSVHCG